jgi:2-iminobutanoate/2-iminopropanoate deaminase
MKTTTYGPYSPYQQAGNFVYTAGQVGAVKGRAGADIAKQTKLALRNVAATLELVDYSLKDVIKVTVFLTNMKHFAAMNEVYREVFEQAGSQPARSTVEVSGLPAVADKPLLVEIEVVAYKESN